MPDVQEVFRMATQKVRPEHGFMDRQDDRQRRRSRNRKLGGLAVAATIAVAAVVVILGARSGPDAITPADDPTVAPTDAVEEVARGFLRAYGALDAEQALAYLADDADISGLITSVGARGVVGTREELRLLFSYLDAARFQSYVSQPCEVSSSASGTSLHCPFSFHLLGSYEMGRGPFGGSHIDLTVRDGEIVRASQQIQVEEFSPQMWEPFAAWVSSTHPEDAVVMYTDETYSGAQLTKESILLWRERAREYMNEINAPGAVNGPTIGRHSRTVDGVRFSFRLATSGWEQFGTISINKSIVGPQGAEAMIFWASFPEGDQAEPCADLLNTSLGPSAADLAAAVATAPGTELVAGPSDVTVGGLPAKHVVLAVREDAGCDPGYFYTWQDVWWGALWPGTNAGDTIRVWIVDVDGTRLLIEAETTTEADSGLEQEIEQIIDSIRFE
jgi:hypothetical protein